MNTPTKTRAMKTQTKRGLLAQFCQSLKLCNMSKLPTLLNLSLLGAVALGLVACSGGGGSSGGGGGGGQMTLKPVVVTVADAKDLGVINVTGGAMTMSLTRQGASESGVNPNEDTYKVEYAVATAVSMDLANNPNIEAFRLFSENGTLLYSTNPGEDGQAIDNIRPSSALAPRSSNGLSPRNDSQTFRVVCPPGIAYYIVVVLPDDIGENDDYDISIEVAPATIPVDDHKDSFAESTPLPKSGNSGNIAGVIGSLEDVDVFSFNLTTAMEVSLWTTGDTGTVGALYNSRNQRVAGPVNGGNNGFSFAVNTLAPGDYFVAVSGSLGATKSTGSYTLRIFCESVASGWRFWSRARFEAYTDAIQTKTYKPGATFDLFSLMGNDSRAVVDSPAITLTYYRATAAAFAGRSEKVIDPSVDTVVGTSDAPILQPGANFRAFVQAIAPTPVGTYHYATCVPHRGNLGRQCSNGDVDEPNRNSDYVTVIVDPAGAGDSTSGGTVAGYHLSAGASLNEGFTEFSATFAANTAFALHVSTCNWIRAADPSPLATTVTAYRSPDNVIGNAADTSVGTGAVPVLFPGQCSDRVVTPTTPTTPGVYYYGACAPASINSVNNADAGRCSPTKNSVGDLGLVAVTVPAPASSSSGWYFWSRARIVKAYGDDVKTVTYKPGSTFDLYALIGNAGGNYGTAASPAISLTYYRATEESFSLRSPKVINPFVDTNVGSSNVPALKLDEDYRTFIQAIAPTPVGTYHYAMCVPHSGNLGERCSLERFSSSGARGYVTVIVDPNGTDGDTGGDRDAGFALSTNTALNTGFTEHAATFAANTQFTLQVSSCNWLRSAANSQATTVTVYRSSDKTITDDGNDTSVATGVVPALFPGQCAYHTPTLTTPSTAGVYYYGSCVPGTINGETNQEGATRCSPEAFSDGDPGFVTVTVPAATRASAGACVSGQVYTPGQFCTLAYGGKNYTFDVYSASPWASVTEGGTLNYGARFANPAVGIISELYWNVPYVASVPFLPIRAYESSDTNYKVELGAACVSGHAYTEWEWCTYTYNSKEYFFNVDPPDSYFAGIVGDDDGGSAGACVRDAGWAEAGTSANVDICNDEGSVSPYGVSITENANGSFTLTLL